MDERVEDWTVQTDDALERRLRTTLRRVDAPAGFSDRVMTHVSARSSARLAARTQPGASVRRAVWGTALAATLLLGVGGGAWHAWDVREEHKAADARAQVDMAMGFASHAMGRVQNSVDRSRAGQFIDRLGR